MKKIKFLNLKCPQQQYKVEEPLHYFVLSHYTVTFVISLHTCENMFSLLNYEKCMIFLFLTYLSQFHFVEKCNFRMEYMGSSYFLNLHILILSPGDMILGYVHSPF